MIRISNFAGLTACAVYGTRDRAGRNFEENQGHGAITIGHRDASIPFSLLDDKQRLSALRWTCARRSSMRQSRLRCEDRVNTNSLLGEPHPLDGQRYGRSRVRLDDQ